jgi:hypothetical protein
MPPQIRFYMAQDLRVINEQLSEGRCSPQPLEELQAAALP